MRYPFRTLVAGALASVVFAPSALAAGRSAVSTPRPTAETCKAWNVTGTWHATQSNLASQSFHLVQRGNKLTGTAVIPPYEATGLGYSTGSITGTVMGSHIDLLVHWERSSVDGVRNLGHYFGAISATRLVGGANNLARDPATEETWSAHGIARCAAH